MGERPQWPKKGPEIEIPNLPNVPRKTVITVLIVIGLLLLAFTSYYQVEPEEEAVVLRFGQYTGETKKPGPQFRIPIIDQVYKVPVNRQLKEEFGFRTAQAGVRTSYERRAFLDESLMLTGDLNVVNVEWIVQYRISDPYLFLFKVRNVRDTFRDLAEAVTRAIIGDNSVDEVLTIGRERIASEAKLKLQELCDLFETGIKVEQFVFQDVNPPEKVKASFNEVNESIQEKERLINEAWSEYNRAVPRARGEAEQMIRGAEGYALERVNNAQGETARFRALYDEYRKAPEVTKRRLYLETLERVLPRMGDKVVVDDSLQNLLPLLQLGGGTGQGGSGPARMPANQGGGAR
jgi:membrane protease subunit HflK